MKGIIIYKGKYGATRQYAEWLSQELDLNFSLADELDINDNSNRFFILGSSVYIGKLQLSKWLQRNKKYLLNKKIFFFLVAGTPPSETEKLMGYIKTGIPEEIQSNCSYYFLPGRLNMEKLSWKDKFMLRMGARLAKDPADRANMLRSYDLVKKENLEKIILDVARHSKKETVDVMAI